MQAVSHDVRPRHFRWIANTDVRPCQNAITLSRAVLRAHELRHWVGDVRIELLYAAPQDRDYPLIELSTFSISMDARAASSPLLPTFPPARSRA